MLLILLMIMMDADDDFVFSFFFSFFSLAARQRTASFTLVSVASQFRESLDSLLNVINNTEVLFVLLLYASLVASFSPI